MQRKAVLRGNFIAVDIYINKAEISEGQEWHSTRVGAGEVDRSYRAWKAWQKLLTDCCRL